jgi:RNA polymerase sigma factor (sigma-70 family)
VRGFPTPAPLRRVALTLVSKVMDVSSQLDDNTTRLLVCWQSGNRDAGDRLLHRYVPELEGFFGKRAGRNADELVQRTLLACTQSLGRFEGRSTFRTYLFGIARNQYLMYRRAEAFSGAEPVTLTTLPEESPSQLVAVRQEQVLLMMALQRVEPDFARVLRMFYWEERSIEEIADELEIPLGTVKSRLARGRGSLKAHLAKVPMRDELRTAALRELVSWFTARSE